MKLRLIHRSEYHYDGPVVQNWNELRFQPRSDAAQLCSFFLLRILPATPLKHFSDLHGNCTHYFEVTEPHQRLLFEATSVVETKPGPGDAPHPLGHPHSELHVCRQLTNCHTFIGDSRLVQITPEIWREAVDARDGSNDVFQTALNIMRFIHEAYRYESGVTSVDTTAEQVFQGRKGVCQDFAHIMLAMLRSLDIPSRYVSGYFFDPTREQNLRGSHASHAWCEIYLHPRGWIGFDPTNNQIVCQRYIAVARGRDYNDVAPVRGTFIGGSKRTMTVAVSVDKIT